MQPLLVRQEHMSNCSSQVALRVAHFQRPYLCGSTADPRVTSTSLGCQHVINSASWTLCMHADPYKDIDEPTVKLGLALGLNPGRLAIYNGHLGTESASAVAALKFALAHPLTSVHEGLDKAPHSHQMTRSVAAKCRPKAAPAALPKVAVPADLK